MINANSKGQDKENKTNILTWKNSSLEIGAFKYLFGKTIAH